MNKLHPSDEEIQGYILNQTDQEGLIEEHLTACRHCRSKAEHYRQIFAGIENQPVAMFDFDVSARVLSKITTARAKRSSPVFIVLLATLSGAVVISMTLYKFGGFTNIINEISAMTLYLILIVTVALLVFQSMDLSRRYQSKMDELNYY